MMRRVKKACLTFFFTAEHRLLWRAERLLIGWKVETLNYTGLVLVILGVNCNSPNGMCSCVESDWKIIKDSGQKIPTV